MRGFPSALNIVSFGVTELEVKGGAGESTTTKGEVVENPDLTEADPFLVSGVWRAGEGVASYNFLLCGLKLVVNEVVCDSLLVNGWSGSW